MTRGQTTRKTTLRGYLDSWSSISYLAHYCPASMLARIVARLLVLVPVIGYVGSLSAQPSPVVSFGTNGVAHVPTSSNSHIDYAAPAREGLTYIAGSHVTFGRYLARVTPLGVRDSAIGEEGLVRPPFRPYRVFKRR